MQSDEQTRRPGIGIIQARARIEVSLFVVKLFPNDGAP